MIKNESLSVFELDLLNIIMEKALLDNKPKFIQLLIDNNFDFGQFFSIDFDLYNWSYHYCRLKDKSRIFRLYNHYINLYEKAPFIRYLLSKRSNKSVEFENVSKELEGCLIFEIKNFIEKVTGYRYLIFLDASQYLVKVFIINEKSDKIDENMHHLFVWSVLCNQPDIAKLFLDKIDVILNFLYLLRFSFQK
jgi:hypothetical protein